MKDAAQRRRKYENVKSDPIRMEKLRAYDRERKRKRAIREKRNKAIEAQFRLFKKSKKIPKNTRIAALQYFRLNNIVPTQDMIQVKILMLMINQKINEKQDRRPTE